MRLIDASCWRRGSHCQVLWAPRPAIAAEVADAAAEYAAAESILLDYLRSGSPEVKAFGEARRAMMDAIVALGSRVRAKAIGV